MTWDLALDIIFDALKDSSLVFALVFFIHVLLSFFENSLANMLIRRRKAGVIFGSLFGLVPQCGTSVMGADLYLKRYITIGTLMAIFLSCSDEALIAIFASGQLDKMLMGLLLIGLKFSIGVVIGLFVDLIFRKQSLHKKEHIEEEEECHHHHTENNDAHKHIVHPLMHSLEIFAYVLVINLIIGFVIGFVGEERFIAFVQFNKYLSPILASLIGLIPNCASSLLLTELFLQGSLSFGALLSGLLVNAGLGTMVLLKNKSTAKHLIWIIGISFMVSIAAGYIACLIIGF